MSDPPSADGAPAGHRENLLAMLVRMGRSMRGRKRKRSLILVRSLSTVERVERAESMSAVPLERVGVALGYERGDFTRERIPLSSEETYASIERDWGGLVRVRVARASNEAQLGAMSHCHATLKIGRAFNDDARARLDELYEWVDLIGIVRSDDTPSHGP